MLFDEDFSPSEQLPRRLRAEFTATPGPYGQVVRLVVNDTEVGDPLTDRGCSETGYRWHDALHLAHATCLGWSPVLRSVAGLRRRSHPRIDHIEDGGRAIVADEAIAWATFCYARTHHWLPGALPSWLWPHPAEHRPPANERSPPSFLVLSLATSCLLGTLTAGASLTGPERFSTDPDGRASG